MKSVATTSFASPSALRPTEWPHTARRQGRVKEKQLLTDGQLEAAIDGVRVAVAAAFPGGLPEWDLVRRVLEATEALEGTAVRTKS